MAFSRSSIPSMLGSSYWDAMDYHLDQHFGTGLYDSELPTPTMVRGYHYRPRTHAAMHSSGQSEIKNEKGTFKEMLNVKHFNLNEVEVKVVDNCVVIHGKHEEKTDEHGFIQREFTRRYVLPEGTEAETIKSSWSPNGILTIEAPKIVVEPPTTNERVVPITVEQQSVEDKK